MKYNMNPEPSAIVLVVEGDQVDQVEELVVNTDARQVLEAAKLTNGFAVVTGPLWEEDGGALSAYAADSNAVVGAVKVVLKGIGRHLSDEFSHWMIFTNNDTKKRVTRYLRKEAH